MFSSIFSKVKSLIFDIINLTIEKNRMYFHYYFDMRNNGGEDQITKLLLSFIFNKRII